MEILIVLGCVAVVGLGYLVQYLVNKVKKGNSVLSKELSSSFKITFLVILLVVEVALVIFINLNWPSLSGTMLTILVPLTVIIIIGLFSKSGISFVGVSGGKAKSEMKK